VPGIAAGLAYTPNMVYIFKNKIKNVNQTITDGMEMRI
jgi:hypothetical protein